MFDSNSILYRITDSILHRIKRFFLLYIFNKKICSAKLLPQDFHKFYLAFNEKSIFTILRLKTQWAHVLAFKHKESVDMMSCTSYPHSN